MQNCFFEYNVKTTFIYLMRLNVELYGLNFEKGGNVSILDLLYIFKLIRSKIPRNPGGCHFLQPLMEYESGETTSRRVYTLLPRSSQHAWII